MNALFILSDQHNAGFAGCYGHPQAHTPNLDALARRGTRFAQAYCASPFCVPARAALFTGRYAHEIGIWDNTLAWNGVPPGWSHHLRENGVPLTTVGKLDFAPGVDHGIGEERVPLHRTTLDVCGLFREEAVPRLAADFKLKDIQPRPPGQPPTFDQRVLDSAVEWLRRDRPRDRPWALNVNFVAPHPPWRPRADLWEKYRGTLTDLPAKYWRDPKELHPSDRSLSIHTCAALFSRDEVLRCHEAYLATIEELDEQIGRLLAALADEGLQDDTLVIYASDHGEMLRAHCSWGKCSMYEDSIRVPLLVAGPGVPAGRVEEGCVSHLDIFPTICEAVGIAPRWDLRGTSLLSGRKQASFVLSEFHGNGHPEGIFAVRSGHWKLVEVAHGRPQLYDLSADPDEMRDLAAGTLEPAAAAKLAELRGLLSGVCSPQAVDARAKADQARLRAELAASGRLAEELYKRGFERRTDRMVNREEFVPREK